MRDVSASNSRRCSLPSRAAEPLMPIQSSMREVDGHDRHLCVDGLRAVAVLSVVVYHACKYAGHGGPPLLARVLQMCAHGVDLFFILSEFCLAYPCL
jgi:peptidoglycan/LPS O-acetylase OafA/YrhL